MNRNTKDKWTNAFKINPHASTLANCNNQTLVEEHGYERVTLEGRRPDNSKVFKNFVKFQSLKMDDQAEIFLKQNKAFISFATECQQDDDTRFSAYKQTLDNYVADLYDVLLADGNFWYDPDHDDAENNDGFLRSVEALFMTWSDDNQPRASMATKILKFTWKGEQIHGTLYPPKLFRFRLQALWQLHDMLPENGPAVTDDQILRAVWDGLPDSAQDYIRYDLREDPFDSENDGADAWPWMKLFDNLTAYWNNNCKEKYYSYDDKKNKRKRDDDDGDDRRNKGPKRQRNGRRNGRGGGNGNERNNDRANGDGKTNHFNKPCKLHENSNHLYKDCIFCPTGEKFNAERAKKFYESGNAPGWYKKTYKRRIIDGKGNRNPKQQEQQQQPQQQFFFQPTPQQGTYMSFPATTVSTQQQSLPPVPSYFQQAPPQLAPTFATGTTSSASSLTASAAASQQQPLYQLRTDAASGKQYFTQL